jgi:hypothetical protein
MRLNAIAQDRAATIAIRIQSNWCGEGNPWDATNVLIKANGNAKTECSTLIIRRVSLSFWKNIFSTLRHQDTRFPKFYLKLL